MAETLSSVAAQSHSDWEVVLVLDGDCPENRAAAEALPSERVQVLVTESPKSGPAVARNMGLAVAKHEFVAFLDADDVCHPDRLGRQAARLQAQPDLSLIGASARKVDVAGRPVGQFRSITDSNRLSKVMLWYNCLTTSTIMVRQSLALGVGGFDPRLVRLEDYDLWLRLLARAEGAVMAEALIDYRVHPGQLSRGGLLGPSTKLLWGSRLALARRIGVTPAGAAMRHMAWVAIQVANRRW